MNPPMVIPLGEAGIGTVPGLIGGAPNKPSYCSSAIRVNSAAATFSSPLPALFASSVGCDANSGGITLRTGGRRTGMPISIECLGAYIVGGKPQIGPHSLPTRVWSLEDDRYRFCALQLQASTSGST